MSGSFNTENRVNLTLDWQSKASLDVLRKRAELSAKVRHFFSSRGVLEVETPLLGSTAGTDLQLEPFRVPIPFLSKRTAQIKEAQTQDQAEFQSEPVYYLQTSPEFAMKRLLAAGSGPIYQLCKAFRQDEVGRRHNPEFTMLEWYHPNIDHHTLMQEVDDLLMLVLKTQPAEKVPYYNLFKDFFKVRFDDITLEILRDLVLEHTSFSEVETLDVSACYDLLFSMVIEPKIGLDKPVFVYDYPIEQKALAKVNQAYPPVAERFEVYYKGMELANGYHELTDAQEQLQRFEKENKERINQERLPIDIDYKLVAAVANMPPSSGVALGFDRLCMLSLQAHHIEEVITFSFDAI